MDPALAAYLARHPALEESEARWGADRSIHLRLSTHLADALPPLAFVSNVRCLLFRGDELMVLRNRDSDAYVVPGGRREGDEPIDATLRREIGEETGWTLRDPVLLGFFWLHHLTPMPPGYPHPYPDLLQLVYAAEADRPAPKLLVPDDYELGGGFRPLAEVQYLPLTRGERVLLAEALRRRRSDVDQG